MLTCHWPRCSSADICCLVSAPDDPSETAPVCTDHFEVWHAAQDPAARNALARKLFRRVVHTPVPPAAPEPTPCGSVEPGEDPVKACRHEIHKVGLRLKALAQRVAERGPSDKEAELEAQLLIQQDLLREQLEALEAAR